MATTIEVLARLRADASNFTSGMREAAGAAERFEKSVDGSSGRVSKAFLGIGKAAMGLGVAFGGAAVAAGGYGLKIAMANEQAQISFETMLGSAEKASAFLNDIQQFAAKTPFEFPELRNAASKLLAVGTEAKDVIPIMTALGDSTAAMGTGSEGINRAVYAIQQMSQKGKIAGQEMMQLAEAGVPAYAALAASIGKSVPETQKLVEQGKLGVGDLLTAIQSYAGPGMQRVKGMMDEQSKTLTGMISTLKDTVGLQMGTFMQPVVGAIKDQLPAFTDAIDGTLKSLGPSIEKLMGSLIPVLSSLLPALEPLLSGFAIMGADIATSLVPVLEMFGEVLTQLAPVFPDLASVVVSLVAALLPLVKIMLEALVPVIVMAADVFRVLVDFIASNKAVFLTLAAGATAIAVAIYGVPLAIGLLVTALIAAYQKIGWFRAIVDTVANVLKTVFVGAFEIAQKVVGAVVGFISDHWRGMLQVILALTGPIGIAVALFWKFKDQIFGAVGAVWGFVRDKVGGVIDFFKNIPSKIGSLFQGLSQILTSPFKSAFNGIASLWNNTIGKLSFSVPSWVPGLGGKGWSVPDIPMLAKGGIVTKPTLAMIGEAGSEAVIPTTKLDRFLETADGMERRLSNQLAVGLQAQRFGTNADSMERNIAKNLAPALRFAKKRTTSTPGAGTTDTTGGTGSGSGSGSGKDKKKDALEKQMDALVKKAEAARDKVKAAKQAYDDFKGAVEDGIKSQTSLSKAMDRVKEMQQEYNDRVDAAKEKLQEAKDAFKDYSDSIKSGISGTISFSDAMGAANEQQTSFLDQLKAQAERAKNWGSLIAQLVKAGLSKRALEQVMGAGVEAGSAIAQQLLDGGADAIKQTNDLTNAIDKYAGEIGDKTASSYYGAGVTSAEAMLAGIGEFSADLVAEFAAQGEKAKVFAERVKTLTAMGLSKENITDVLGAGAEAGTAIADALIKGGAQTIKQANDITDSVKKVATEAGTLAADTFYAEGVKVAEAMLRGMEETLRQFEITHGLDSGYDFTPFSGTSSNPQAGFTSPTITVKPGAVNIEVVAARENISPEEVARIVNNAVQDGWDLLAREVMAL